MKASLRSCIPLIVAGCFAVQVHIANAEIVTTDQIAADQQAPSDREKVKAFLDRAGVQTKLQALGVRAVMAKERVDALTDQEVAVLAQRIDQLPAGGDLSKTDLIIILLVAILVALVI